MAAIASKFTEDSEVRSSLVNHFGTDTSTIVAVNPAFLQEIKDSNPEFWQTLHQLRQACQCEEEPSQVASNLVRLLDSFRDQIALQFALEESYGYIELNRAEGDLRDGKYRCESVESLGALARDTRSQHCSLYLQVSELAEMGEELQYRGVAARQLHQLVKKTEEFDVRFREHECAEDDLIERSFGV